MSHQEINLVDLFEQGIILCGMYVCLLHTEYIFRKFCRFMWVCVHAKNHLGMLSYEAAWYQSYELLCCKWMS